LHAARDVQMIPCYCERVCVAVVCVRLVSVCLWLVHHKFGQLVISIRLLRQQVGQMQQDVRLKTGGRANDP